MAETFGVYINQAQQLTGSKARMLQQAKKIVKGHVAVWKLDAKGLRIGRKPIYRAFDGIEK